ncbi:MAG: RimK family alpha-L-glutamate ligase [Lysobacterales bacterium]
MSKKNLPIAFLTTDDLHGHVSDDHLAVQPLSDLGWSVQWVSWRENVDWSKYAAVVIRTPWDYTEHPEAFVTQLKAIERSATPLGNSLSTVCWNLDKTYLRELSQVGLRIVPTRWLTGVTRQDLEACARQFETDQLVLKPQLGASAKDTFKLTPAQFNDQLASNFSRRPSMVQPFLEQIVTEGEYSLFFFAGALSHAINKRPARGDFRVQEEHGGVITEVDPDAKMMTTATDIVGALPEQPLYARVDMVGFQDSFALMELELVEPSLYLRMSSKAPHAFARAINQWLLDQ